MVPNVDDGHTIIGVVSCVSDESRRRWGGAKVSSPEKLNSSGKIGAKRKGGAGIYKK